MGPSDNPQAALGQAIRQLRSERGTSQENLAHDAGVTTGTLSLVERGLSNPTWGTVKGISAALGVSVVSLAKEAERIEHKADSTEAA